MVVNLHNGRIDHIHCVVCTFHFQFNSQYKGGIGLLVFVVSILVDTVLLLTALIVFQLKHSIGTRGESSRYEKLLTPKGLL